MSPRLAARIRHPNVVPVTEVDADAFRFLVTPPIRSGSWERTVAHYDLSQDGLSLGYTFTDEEQDQAIAEELVGDETLLEQVPAGAIVYLGSPGFGGRGAVSRVKCCVGHVPRISNVDGVPSSPVGYGSPSR